MAAARRLVPVPIIVLLCVPISVCSRSAERERGALPAPPRPTMGYVTDIDQATVANEDFRHVLFTAEHSQLVVMALRPGEEISVEVHEDGDQFFRVEAGTGTVTMNGRTTPIQDGSAFVVPAGVTHNVVNTGQTALKLYTIYCPPRHPPGTVHRTKQEAEAARR